MAAGGSGSIGKVKERKRVRVGSTGNGSSLPRLAPAEIATIESLEDLCGWLGTFRERMRIASEQDSQTVRAMIKQLETRYMQRRAELS